MVEVDAKLLLKNLKKLFFFLIYKYSFKKEGRKEGNLHFTIFHKIKYEGGKH